MTKHQKKVLFAIWNGQRRPTVPDTASRSQRGGIEVQWMRACGALHAAGLMRGGQLTDEGRSADGCEAEAAQA